MARINRDQAEPSPLVQQSMARGQQSAEHRTHGALFMDAPDGCPNLIGHGEHLQLRKDPVLWDRNAVGHHQLLKQALGFTPATTWLTPREAPRR